MEATTTSNDNVQKKDVYAIVTEKIIEQLEKGTVPWHVPWHSAGIPCNLISRRPYRGMNLMLLACYGYEQNFFLTFSQLKELGGKVKKDERGHLVVFWKRPEKSEGVEVKDENEKKAVLRYYIVFNISQCENIPEDKLPSTPYRIPASISACEDIVSNMPKRPVVKFKEHRAYYDPLKDFINMPKQKSFESDEAYYSTLFHELVHSTGHHSRLDRKDLLQMAEFGSEAYSHEELVAEIATCYLQSYTGITSQFEQSAAYIQGWLWKLKNDKRFILSASTHAQKASDYILNVQGEPDEETPKED